MMPRRLGIIVEHDGGRFLVVVETTKAWGDQAYPQAVSGAG